MRSNHSMEDPVPELSPDVEWMLESGQASSEMLADALVREYLQPAYRFGLACLNDSLLAEQVAIESLSTALMQSYSYRGGSVQAWLFRIVIQVCQEKGARITHRVPPGEFSRNKLPPDSIGEADPKNGIDGRLWDAIEAASQKNRSPFLLSYLFDWSPELVAQTCKSQPEIITKRLKMVHFRLIENLKMAGYPADELEPKRVEFQIRQLMEARWPGMELSPSKLNEMIEAVITGAEQQRSHSHKLASVKELSLVVIVVALAAALIFGGNLLFPEPEATQSPARRVLVTRLVEVANTPTPTPTSLPTATGTPTPLPPPVTPQPLTLQSSSEDVWNRIYFSIYAYRTLSMDALVEFYGPEGFDGAPQAYQVQIWLDKTFPAILLIGGIPSMQAEEISLSRSGINYWTEIDGVSPYKVHKIVSQQASRSWYAANLVLYQLFKLGDTGTYQVVGREEMLGRESLIVDYINPAGQRVATLWLDSQTGLPLRQRYFIQSQEDLYYDIRLLDFQIDPEIPANLFNPEYPWTGAFAQYARDQALSAGRTVPEFYITAERDTKNLPFALAPEGFDPSQSELYFRVSRVYFENPPGPGDPLPFFKASVFTRDYFLGDMDFEDPWDMICARSPDGSRLAIADQANPNRSLLRLFDLTGGGTWNGRTIFGSASQFAFAPDSRRLAIFTSNEPFGSVYVMDTGLNKITHLINLSDARSFAWSPDGEYLAMIGRVTEPIAGDEVIVVRASDGAITYHKSVDYGFGNLGDWPPLEWGVEFPVEMQGLSHCALPPGGP